MKNPTVIDYLSRAKEFYESTLHRELVSNTQETMDVSLIRFLEHLLWEGHPSADGLKLVAAVQFLLPPLQKALPRAQPAETLNQHLNCTTMAECKDFGF